MGNKVPSSTLLGLSFESLADVLDIGYGDEVRAITHRIRTNSEAVHLFESYFDELNKEALINWKTSQLQNNQLEQVEALLDDMERFLRDSNRPYQSYLSVCNHGPDTTAEVGWIDEVAGAVVWDRWTKPIDDPVMLFAEAGFRFDQKKYLFAAQPSKKPEPPLYRYHPERFRAYRNYADDLSRFYRQRVDPATGLMTMDQFEFVMNLILREVQERSMKTPRKHKDNLPSPSFILDAEQTLSTAYGRFVQAGRQIMEFPRSLTELLAETDVDDIPLNAIKMPYASQYLHFGALPDLEIEDGWKVDGAYIEQRGESGDLRFTVTAVPIDHHQSERWMLEPEVEYSQDFVQEFRLMDLGTAIDTVLSDRLANSAQGAKGVADALSAAAGDLPEGIALVDISGETSIQRTETTKRRHAAYKAAVQLVVNAICYATSYPDDIDSVWPEGTPESLKQKVLNGKPKEQSRAISKLKALGYVPVHICGKRLSEQRISSGLPAHQEGHPATHWRRGHWRNQAHGPARALRKLIWVMPMVIGARSGELTPNMGHIYLVD